jgi:hypothetical protein
MKLRIGESRFCAVSPNECRSHGIYRDAIGRPLECKTSSEVIDRRLAHAIDRFTVQGNGPSLRADVDDAPRSSLYHCSSDGLRHEECSFEVDVQDKVKIFFVNILGMVSRSYPIIVDQDVYPSKTGYGCGNG